VLGKRESAEIRLHRVFAPDEEMYADETIYFSDQRESQLSPRQPEEQR
jgi:hypothetical protein